MTQFCGCCGGTMATQTEVWCEKCKPHIRAGVPFWEATWYAQHGKYCPLTTTQFIPFGKQELKAKGLICPQCRGTGAEPSTDGGDRCLHCRGSGLVQPSEKGSA